MLHDIRNSSGIILLFTLLFIGLSWYYDLDYWLTQRPKSVHVWRQTDCASYALNYYQNERSFFSPQVHHRHAINGSTASEFPIIYYIASKLYTWFGFDDRYIRWIGYAIYYLSLISLILASGYFIKNKILQLFPAILMMMSCVLIYYAANYLPDVPALSFAIIGFYFFVRNIYHGKKSDLYLAISFGALAALLKISSGLILGTILLYILYQKLIIKNNQFNITDLIAIFGGFSLIFMWLYYVKNYNEAGQYFGNLQGTMGIWLCDSTKIGYIFKRTFEEWIPALGSRKLWLLFLPATIFVAYYWRKLDAVLKFFIPVLFCGSMVYYVAFFAVFDVHDYYFVNMFIFPIILSIGFFHILEQKLKPIHLRYFIAASIVLFAMTAEDTSAQFYNRRYHGGWNSSPPSGFFKIEPYLRSLGIDRHQLIYSPSDGSTNITLYYANNPGWTKLFGTTAESAISRGASYMLIVTAEFDSEEFSKYKDKVIGEFEGVSVVKF